MKSLKRLKSREKSPQSDINNKEINEEEKEEITNSERVFKISDQYKFIENPAYELMKEWIKDQRLIDLDKWLYLIPKWK